MIKKWFFEEKNGQIFEEKIKLTSWYFGPSERKKKKWFFIGKKSRRHQNSCFVNSVRKVLTSEETNQSSKNHFEL